MTHPWLAALTAASLICSHNVKATEPFSVGLQGEAQVAFTPGADAAGLVVGAKVPIIINSRADTAETRYLSLAMAVVLARVDRGQEA